MALAVSEAITNAVLHAYREEQAGPMRVVACAEPDRLVVVVRDYGCGMSPNPDSPGLGLGLAVIGRLATELNIERPDEGGGTRLRMCFANALIVATALLAVAGCGARRQAARRGRPAAAPTLLPAGRGAATSTAATCACRPARGPGRRR